MALKMLLVQGGVVTGAALPSPFQLGGVRQGGGFLPANSREEFMLVSEDVARTKWCPHARVAEKLSDGGNIMRLATGHNRVEFGNIPACIASSCMAWRFGEPKQIRDIDLVTSDVMDDQPRLGYCGLSGRPDQGD